MDDVSALLQEARAAGLRVEAAGDRLEVRGPKSAEPIVRRLRAAKPAIMAALVSGRPAPESPAPTVDPAGFGPVLRAAGQAVGFKVPTVDVELYLVADEGHADELVREGIGRGRCWTPEEIRVVIGLSVAGRQAVAITKVEIDGMVEDVIDDA